MTREGVGSIRFPTQFDRGGSWAPSDLHRMVAIMCDLGYARGAITIARSPSDGGRFIGRWIFIEPTVARFVETVEFSSDGRR